MAAPETPADASAKKMLPWLKRLKGALDDDDSSDSTSQQSEATPQTPNRPHPGKTRKGKGRRVRSKSPKQADKTRPASAESSSSADEGQEVQRRRVTKATRRQKLQLVPVDGPSTTPTAFKRAKAPVDAAASREQRMLKLRALRRDTGEGARLTAFKLKRQQSSEALKERERRRMRAIRARRVSKGDEADVEEEGGAPVPSAAPSFVIPKRSFAKPGAQMEAPKVQANKEGDKHPLEPRVPVVLKPLPSPEASPQLSKPGRIRPLRKRTKNPVPVKPVVILKEDQAVMRLAKRRNSIFMATAEISARSPVVNDAAKPSTSRMTGYEVFGVHGKALTDLIPRLSCATKRELASDRESYAASFFGVSLSAPESKGRTSPKPDDCVADEAKTREINCYEKLCFERPKDREFYQKRMYGTTFVPQPVRGWITVIVRKTRFERKSTGIRFNQDRDRDEFATSLVKRYSINKSVPRCDIPRENWQKLMRNQPGTVYLHYYNREDAKQASQVYRDDFGNPLELKTEYKAGVVISPSSSPAADLRFQGTPRRSCSSERNAPRPSPLSAQNGSARNTPIRQRDRLQALKGANRFSRYDRGTPPGAVPWPRDGGRYGPSLSGNKRPRRSRSRSRSKSKPLPSEHFDPATRNSGASSTSIEWSSHSLKVKDELVPEFEEGIGAGSKSSDGTLAQERGASRSPLRSRSSFQNSTMSDKETHSDRGVSGERENRGVRAQPGGNDDSGRAHHARSPRGQWSQQPNRSERHEPRGRSRENVMGYRQGQERVSHVQDNKTRSRSPRRQPPSFGGRDGNRGAPYTKERRQRSQDVVSSDGKTRGERIPNRHDGQDYRNRGPRDRRRGMHSQR